MASIQKIGKKWKVQVRAKGESFSKRFYTKQEAQEWGYEKERQIGKYGPLIANYTLGDALQRFSEEVSPTHKGHRWEVIRIKKLQRDKISLIMLNNLCTQDLQNWINRQTIRPASIHRELNLIQSTLRRCRNPWRWMYEDIAKDLIKPKLPKHRERRISNSEESQILEALGYEEGQAILSRRHYLAAAFLLALETLH